MNFAHWVGYSLNIILVITKNKKTKNKQTIKQTGEETFIMTPMEGILFC